MYPSLKMKRLAAAGFNLIRSLTHSSAATQTLSGISVIDNTNKWHLVYKGGNAVQCEHFKTIIHIICNLKKIRKCSTLR